MHYTFAAVVEMIHTATLLHDDVVDESELRRGHATANAKFGNAASRAGRRFPVLARVPADGRRWDRCAMLEILSNATNVIAEGEVLQLMNSGDPAVDEATYLGVIRRKTAKLFEAAAQLGAVLGGRVAGARGRARALRHAPRHRVPADRRRARLLGRPGRDRQEPGRRPRRRQDDAAADPRDRRGQRRRTPRSSATPSRGAG